MTHPSQPPQYGQPSVSGGPAQPLGYAPQQPPKRRKKWPWIVGGITLVMLAGCIGGFVLLGAGANEVAKSLDEVDQNAKGQNAVAGVVGKPAKDGKFEFTVSGMKCGATEVGPEFATTKAQGEFCQVSVQVKNIGQTAELFDSSSQKAYAGTTEFSVDGAAELAVNEDAQTFFENINPGNKVKGVLIFDVPKDTKLDSIVLHESFYTAGIRVPLK